MTLEEFEQVDKKEITYDNIADYIDKLFPEYVKSERYYEADNKELQYVHLGNLSLMVLEDLDSESDLELPTRLVKLANYIINNFGGELQNLFCIEVFEPLGGRTGARLAKQYLNGEALDIFHENTKFYNTPEFLDEYYKVFGLHSITAREPNELFDYMTSSLHRPNMGPPEDDEFLTDIRIELEMDEDLIAGSLSYLKGQSLPPQPQIKKLREVHRQNFGEYIKKLRLHHTESLANKTYMEELILFIHDLGRIASRVDIWIWNNFNK